MNSRRRHPARPGLLAAGSRPRAGGEANDCDRGSQEAIRHGAPGLGRGVLHQLSPGLRQQRRPGAGLDPGGVQEDRRRVRLPAFAPGEQLVPALHPQPGQPDPLRRAVPARPRSCGPPPDQAAGRDSCSARRRLHAGARPGRHLPDDGAAREEDRPDEEPEHHQERLVAHPGGAGHRADAAHERHDPRRRRDRRVPLPRRLVRRARRCWRR